uniref:Uncharacterized protein n=1 Tax=Kalanchoe fedtschenkoi TaxID=63787 RepID=A0A7N0UAL8_KALFE
MTQVALRPLIPAARSMPLPCASPTQIIIMANDPSPSASATRREEEASAVDLLIDVIRKSLITGCGNSVMDESWAMEIGSPTNVRHVAHVTFDKFDGFLGLPAELQPEVPSRPLSASASVFGVKTESMQLSFDRRGNSVPTILLMMQQRFYERGGLHAEGVFRINGENGQEEYVRDQLNHGLIPDQADVHCLAGLIKAWFRELPTGILDSLSLEDITQCQTGEKCLQLARQQLPATEAALLDWALDLMADVAQMELLNKMNAYNVAVVFAPNMTRMADPVTALMHAVQLTKFLELLIETRLQQRRESPFETSQSLDAHGNGKEEPVSSTESVHLSSPEESEAAAGHCRVGLAEERQPDSKTSTPPRTLLVQSSSKPHSKRGSSGIFNEKRLIRSDVHISGGAASGINSKQKRTEAWR